MSNPKDQFILHEYSECFSHIRHYDNIWTTLGTFSVSLYTVVAAVCSVLIQNGQAEFFISIILILTFLAEIIIITMIAQNRSYFVATARQVNNIRGAFWENIDFDSFLPLKPTTPKPVNLRSTQLLVMFALSFVNAIVLALGGALLLETILIVNPYLISVILFFLALLLEILVIYLILRNAGAPVN
ncbi:MAG: hypothetical protein ACFFCZ_11225 [Promethearchaeota archaeon]